MTGNVKDKRFKLIVLLYRKVNRLKFVSFVKYTRGVIITEFEYIHRRSRNKKKTNVFVVSTRSSAKNASHGKLLTVMKSERGPDENKTNRTVAACVDASHSPIRKVFHGVSRFMSAT